jgi:hemolysin D
MAETTIPEDSRRVPLTPGMAVAAEVKTGARRAVTFFLSPLLRYVDESLRER